MTIQDSIKICLSKYAEFKGRASRSEYWFWFLFVALVTIASMILDQILGTNFEISDGYNGETASPYGYVYLLVVLSLFLPGLAVTVRRLHDLGKSGWFYLIALIPIAGFIVLLVWFCKQGTNGDNQYGPDPLR